MQTHPAWTTSALNPKATGTVPSVSGNPPAPHVAQEKQPIQTRRTIADLVDDPDALDDWHRNVEQLRAMFKD